MRNEVLTAAEAAANLRAAQDAVAAAKRLLETARQESLGIMGLQMPTTGDGGLRAEGFVNIYAGGYSWIWGDEQSARGTVGKCADAPQDPDFIGPYLRTVRIVELRPGEKVYTKEGLRHLFDAELARCGARPPKLGEVLKGADLGKWARDAMTPPERAAMIVRPSARPGAAPTPQRFDAEVAEDRRYTKAELDAAVAGAVDRVNQSAGRSLLSTLSGMGDMARGGREPMAGSVAEMMESTIDRLCHANLVLRSDLAALRRTNAELVARLGELSRRLDNLAAGLR